MTTIPHRLLRYHPLIRLDESNTLTLPLGCINLTTRDGIRKSEKVKKLSRNSGQGFPNFQLPTLSPHVTSPLATFRGVACAFQKCTRSGSVNADCICVLGYQMAYTSWLGLASPPPLPRTFPTKKTEPSTKQLAKNFLPTHALRNHITRFLGPEHR